MEAFTLALVSGERLSIPGEILEYFGLFVTLHEEFSTRDFPSHRRVRWRVRYGRR